MITYLEDTLKKLFGDEFEEISVAFTQPQRSWQEGNAPCNINFYLYGIGENTKSRRTPRTLQRKENGAVARQLPPHLINVTYLVTTWIGKSAEAKEFEAKLLWQTLALLLRYPELPADQFQGTESPEVNEPIYARVLTDNEVPAATDLWNVIDCDLRPALHYQVTLPLDAAVATGAELPVLHRTLKATPWKLGQDREQAKFEKLDRILIRGTASEKTTEDSVRPLANTKIYIKELGVATTTDAEGRYILSIPAEAILPPTAPKSYSFETEVGTKAPDGQSLQFARKSTSIDLPPLFLSVTDSDKTDQERPAPELNNYNITFEA